MVQVKQRLLAVVLLISLAGCTSGYDLVGPGRTQIGDHSPDAWRGTVDSEGD